MQATATQTRFPRIVFIIPLGLGKLSGSTGNVLACVMMILHVQTNNWPKLLTFCISGCSRAANCTVTSVRLSGPVSNPAQIREPRTVIVKPCEVLTCRYISLPLSFRPLVTWDALRAEKGRVVGCEACPASFVHSPSKSTRLASRDNETVVSHGAT